MRLGVFTALFGQKSLEDALDYVTKHGVNVVELGTGNYPGDPHCKPSELLEDKGKLDSFKGLLADRGVEISALSCHGNPLHPQEEIAKAHHEVFEKTVLLAERLGVDRVIGFSGCPGDSENAKYPNWVTCPWPDDFTEVVNWQWEKKVIPYWKKAGAFARDHGVRVCLEMHPGFVVYNTETLLRLREAVGDMIGANFDPSHLFWQGMDPIACIRKLGGAIFHVHAKDCKVYPSNSEANGVLDTKPYGDEINRSWIFRTVGYGHGYDFWKDFVSTLRMVGYDDVLSIEHEDSLMSVNEGFTKAVTFLKEVLLTEAAGEMWWA
ncbi:MAG TPA: sugar phosphate isomerase/epimerase [Candidatus Latescibacteria bacterium]|nr:sugar phosphate isomerase/epimerase [Candidatus Latescibacterota bacterium]